MTDLTPLRDRLAELCGFRKIEPQVDGGKVMWERGGVIWCACISENPMHPFPPNNLTALAAAWPKDWGFLVSLGSGGWFASASMLNDPCVVTKDIYAPSEYEARLRLTVAVMEAQRWME